MPGRPGGPVGCGAAGAIAAAFGAPVTGPCMAFEPIIGSYTFANFAPRHRERESGLTCGKGAGEVEPLALMRGIGTPVLSARACAAAQHSSAGWSGSP